MEKRYCDICKLEITPLDRTYIIELKEKSNIPFMGNSRKAEACYECMKKFEKFITELKGGK